MISNVFIPIRFNWDSFIHNMETGVTKQVIIKSSKTPVIQAQIPVKVQYINIEMKMSDLLSSTKKETQVQINKKCSNCLDNKQLKKQVKCDICNGTLIVNNIYKDQDLDIHYKFNCQKCKGTGKITQNFCKVCGGTNVVSVKTTIKTIVPRGTKPNSKALLYQDQLNRIIGTIKVTDMQNMKVSNESLDVETTIDVNIFKSIMGGEEKLQYLGQELTIQIPQGASGGQKITIPNKGMYQNEENNIRGNLIVVVNLVVPQFSKMKSVTRNLLKLLSQFFS